MIFYISIFLFWFAFFLLAISDIYYWQIKEYRFDRWWSATRDKKLRNLLWQPWHRPAFTIRNLIIISFVFVTFSAYFGIGAWLLIRANLFYQTLFLLGGLVLSKFLVWLGVMLTKPLSDYTRRRTINQAKDKIKDSKTVFIGITGSFGKTSVKNFLYSILSTYFRVAITDKNQNTDIGVAMSVLKNLKQNTEFFITEMGAYKKGEIRDVCQIVNPKYGILTGLGNQHLDLFGSKENLIEAKSELLQALPPNGRAYVNATSPGYEEAIKVSNAQAMLYGPSDKGEYDINLKRAKVLKNGQKATVIYGAHKLDIKTDLLGFHNLINLLPCIGLALDLGVPAEKIEKSILGQESIPGRLELKKGPNGSTIIDDSYSSNVNGFIEAIKLLNQTDFKDKFIITKGLLELGSAKKSSYEAILNELKDSGVRLYTSDKLFRLISIYNLVTLMSEETMIDRLQSRAGKEAVILLEGRFSPGFMAKVVTN